MSNYNSTLQSNNIDLQAILNTINELPEAVEQAAPTISVNASGLITATAGTKSSTHQLAFQAAKTITPSTASQIAVSSGYYTGGDVTVAAIPSTYVQPSYTKSAATYTPTTVNQTISADTYLTGAQTIKGDANLVAENIKKGVDIFGVNGNYVGSGSGGDSDLEDSLIDGTANIYANDRVTTIRDYAFFSCSNLTEVSFPAAITIGSNAFAKCFSLVTANFSAVTDIKSFAFASCYNLTTANFPAATDMYGSVFDGCSSLMTASFPVVSTIGAYAFRSCTNLTTANFPAALVIDSHAFHDCFNLTIVSFPSAIVIGSGAFAFCSSLTIASFPAAIDIRSNAFYHCSNLTTLSFPAATTIYGEAFESCPNLVSISFPAVSIISGSAFAFCSSLTTASFPAATSIDIEAFWHCYNLKSLYLTGSSLCRLVSSYAFYMTPIGGYSASAGTCGSIYVPMSLLTFYQTATNWAYFSSRFKPNEDFYFEPLKSRVILMNETDNISLPISIRDDVSIPTITVSSDNNSIASVSNMIFSDNIISFDIVTYGIEGNAIITISANNATYSQIETFKVYVLEEMPQIQYTVEAVENAPYGFELNADGYYESTNKGKKSSYALCKVNIYTPIDMTVYIDCINYAESSYDYGLLSHLDTMLALNNFADSDVYYNFINKQSPDIQTITYEVPEGEHFIYVKFIKDGGVDKDNDTLQFKIRYNS